MRTSMGPSTSSAVQIATTAVRIVMLQRHVRKHLWVRRGLALGSNVWYGLLATIWTDGITSHTVLACCRPTVCPSSALGLLAGDMPVSSAKANDSPKRHEDNEFGLEPAAWG